MEVKQDSMAGGSNGCIHEPRRLLDMIMEHERKEIALYHEIAREVPSKCLARLIMLMAEKEAHHVHMHKRIAELYGFAPQHRPDLPPFPPDLSQYYAAGTKKEE